MSTLQKRNESAGFICDCGSIATTKIRGEFVCNECADELYYDVNFDRPSRDNKNRKVRFRDE